MIDIYNDTGGGGDTGDGGTSGGGGPVIGGGSTGGGTSGGGTSIPGLPGATGGAGFVGFNVPTSPYRGLGAINQGGNSLIAALQSIFAQYRAGEISLQEALFESNRLQGYLGNSSVFYQARHGNDASALQNFKAQAASIVSSISSWVAPAAPTPPTDSGGGSTGDTSGPPTPDVTPDTTLQDLLNATNLAQPQTADNYGTLSESSTQTGGSQTTMIVVVILAVAGFLAYRYYKKHNG